MLNRYETQRHLDEVVKGFGKNQLRYLANAS